MAKRKKSRKRSASRFSSFKKRAKRGASRAAASPLIRGAAAAAYGATRGKLNAFIAPVTSKIPFLGDLSDEVLLMGVSMLAKKRVKNKILKSYLDTMFVVEASSLGFQLANRGLSSAAPASSGNLF